MNYEIAEAIAPTWERRRADIEQISAPVREWMIRELRPQEGETVLELAGTGDTGFEAAALIGERGLLCSTDFSPVKAEGEAARERFAGEGGYEIPGVVLCALASWRRGPEPLDVNDDQA
jgi:ubiquinone/menaquinone biosynthesis C-methylase UbiE